MRLSKCTRAVFLAAAFIGVATSVFAQGRGNGRGNGGGPGEETASNNLSVPTIFVGPYEDDYFATAVKLAFPIGAPVYPDNLATNSEPISGFEVPGYYYVQGIHQWQAESIVSSGSVPVLANWGDNLIGEAKLKTGSPIRVEVGLVTTLPDEATMTGWNVVKLEPSLLDRLAFYGTEADEITYSSSPDYYNEVRVYDADAELTIYKADDLENPIVYESPASAEVNATGRIVYGYNLRVQTAGQYLIEFYSPNVLISGTNSEKAEVSADGHMVTLRITVESGGGKGGGRPSR